ncbi:MAG: insulinase family protein [Prevotella sp.]|nr:insulinase family protein [Prevotella sp.]
MTKYNTHTLSNGLRVIHLPSDSQVVYCGLEIAAGTRNERPGEEGLAHFCEHVTFKGTARRRAWHILNCLESVGGELNAFTNKEDTVFYAAILKEHLPRAVDVLTDIVLHSTYPEHEIEKEKAVVCDEIESYNDSPSELIFDEFENILFAGHPLGHNILGTKEQVMDYSSADARRFTTEHYRPDNMIFFAYGDIDFPRLVRLLEKNYTPSSLSPTPSTIHSAPFTLNPPPTTPIIRRLHTHQTHVIVGHRAYSIHDERRMPLYLLNNMLGGPGMNARLNLSLRERNALVYTVESTMVSYADTGMWCLYFGCDEHDTERCLHLVRRELNQFMQHPLSDNQLNAAKKQIKGQIGVACDNREQFALDFGKSFLHYGWEKDITSLYEHIDAITPAQIQQVAQEIFDEKALTTLIYC